MMNTNARIGGELTVGDWLTLEKKLNADSANAKLWEEAFRFFERRMQTRYIAPIEAIARASNAPGADFTICAILCGFLDALETFYGGKSFKKVTPTDPLDESKEYYSAKPIFESILANREPFNKYFGDPALVKGFFEDFRIPLVHEMATRGGWTVSTETPDFLTKADGKTIVNSAIFFQMAKEAINIFRQKLPNDDTLKKAFMQRMAAICRNS